MIMIWLLSTSCSYEDLGLKEVEAEDITESHSLDDISNEDFFYRLKNQQRTQNPFNDLHIRKAILHAVDRERIVEEILGPYGSVLNSLFCSDSPYYYPAWEQYDYDLDLAQEYLQRAGYGPQNPLYVTIGFTERSQAREKIAKIIREDLSQIGIEIWLEDHNSKDWYSSVLKTGDYEMGIWALYNFDGLDLENYFASYKIPPMETSENRSCSNYYWYRNDDVDQVLQDVSYTEDVHQRQAHYTDLQQILADDAVIMPLYSRLYTIAHNHQIENISVHPENGCMLAGLDQWTVEFDLEDRAVVIGYEEEPLVINPFVNSPLFNRYLNGVLFKGLWSKNMEGAYDNVLVREYSRIQSKVAVSTPMFDVTLLDNIYWEDGSPIDSEDVYYTWQAVIGNEALLHQNPAYENIKDIEITSDKQFRIILHNSMDNWKDLFSTLIPADVYLQDADKINPYEDLMVSNGPYTIAGWVKGQHILLERNENYRGPRPDIEYLQFAFNSDTNQLISALKAGDIDVLSVPADLRLLEEIEENAHLELIVEEGNLWEHLAFCLKPLD